MMLDLFEFETVLDAAVEGGGEPEAVAEETPAAEAAPEVPWAPSQDDWQALTARFDALSQAVAPPAPAAAAEPELTEYFATDPNTGEVQVDLQNLGRYIKDQIDSGIKAGIGPYEPVLNQVVGDRGESVVNQQFDRLSVPAGHRSITRDVAEGLVLQSGDSAAAISEAAQKVSALVRAERAAAVEEYRTTLGNVGTAPRDGAAAGIAVERQEPRAGMDGYRDVERAWIERNGGNQ